MMNFIRDMLDQVWTGLGMFVAWLVLDGSAKTVTGYAIIATTVFWAITYPIRNPKDEEE
jgi:phosphotransferase system  glucose/maltose/N-acetylglucosamine-specific IIC component